MTLPHPLPDEIFWLDHRVAELLRPGAFLKKDPTTPAKKGGTRAWGAPDVPLNAVWRGPDGADRWGQSPMDGESFFFQLDLAEIPAELRKPEWPAEGVVWVTLDLSERWVGNAYFDPRPAGSIVWSTSPTLRGDVFAPAAAQWRVQPTLPCVTDETIPELANIKPYSGSAAETYDNWAGDHYQGDTDFQVGGWVWPCQGEHDHRNKDFVCGLTRQDFGDSGAVYLHFNTDKGFYVLVECA